MRSNEIKNEAYEMKKWEEKKRKKNLIYKTNKDLYDFQLFGTKGSFGDEREQINLLEIIVEFNNKVRPKNKT